MMPGLAHLLRAPVLVLQALVLVLLLPTAAAAQSVSVRGGEHGDFTRLVFTMPGRSDWTLDRLEDDSVLRLSLGRTGWRFDVASAFDRIGRNRIAALTTGPEPGTLDIGLACDCIADAYVAGNRMLVLDVRATPADPERTAPVAGSEGAAMFTAIRLGENPGIGPEPASVLPVPSLAPGIAATAPPDPGAGVGLIGEEIASDLARAASMGLLEPSTQVRTAPSPSAAQGAGPPPEPGPADPSDDHAVLTAVARAGEGDKLSIGGSPCTPDRALQITTWSEGGTLDEALWQTRDRLYGEFDRVEDDAVRDHARRLLHFGFGAEARDVLSITDTRPDPVLIALSHLVDGEPDPAGLFRGQEDCPGPASLWAVLAGPGNWPAGPMDTSAVLQAFEALPDHLGRHLGATLADRLVARGSQSAARDVLRRLERRQGEETPEIALQRARLDAASGDAPGALDRLDSVVKAAGPQVPDAVAAAIDVAETEGQPVSGELVELSAAFAQELRHTDDGPALWAAHVKALVANRDFDAAFAALAQSQGVAETQVLQTRRHAATALIEHAADLDFLKHALGGAVAEVSSTPDIAVPLASRLLSLGLPDAANGALGALGSGSDTETGREAKLLKARALLALSQPEEAEILLIGLRGDDVASLRAEARSRMGDHDYAATLFAALDRDEEARRAAWLSGDWDTVARAPSDALGRMAELASGAEARPPGETEITRLETVEALGAAAVESREAIRAMLAETEIGGE